MTLTTMGWAIFISLFGLFFTVLFAGYFCVAVLAEHQGQKYVRAILTVTIWLICVHITPPLIIWLGKYVNIGFLIFISVVIVVLLINRSYRMYRPFFSSWKHCSEIMNQKDRQRTAVEERYLKKTKQTIGATVILAFSVVLIVLFIAKGKINQREKAIKKQFSSYMEEYLALSDLNSFTDLKETLHSGNVVIIDVDKKELHGLYLDKVTGQDKWSGGDKDFPYELLTKSPEEVKTLVFIRKVPRYVFSYNGKLYNPKTDKYTQGIPVYEIDIECKIVNKFEERLISFQKFRGRSTREFPKKAWVSQSKKMGVVLHGMEGGSADVRVSVLYNANDEPYGITGLSPTDFSDHIWELIFSHSKEDHIKQYLQKIKDDRVVYEYEVK